uniref:Phenylalanine--tRNA ligase n=1 Tax=Rhabditophanes sp. KR3021 TaxID=114890 RepID=A0AC35TMT3_9BILA
MVDPQTWNNHFSACSYVKGYTVSQFDFQLLSAVLQEDPTQFKGLDHLQRWINHMRTIPNPKDNVKQAAQPKIDMAATNIEDLPQLLLNHLNINESVDSLAYASTLGVEHQKVIGAVKSLQTVEELIEITDDVITAYELTSEGKEIEEFGSHEFRVWEAVGVDGTLQSEIMKLPFGKFGGSKAMQNKWIAIEKSDGAVKYVRKVETLSEDPIKAELQAIICGNMANLPANAITLLKKRKLLNEVVVKKVTVKKGPQFTTTLVKLEAELTPELILSGEWANKKFKKYNFDALGLVPEMGHLHPLLKVRSEFRDIFLQMGFEEMNTGRWVESSFWNFDALFQPQQHPARDAHDTFFVAEPATTTQFPQDYLERVKEVHSKGGFGSFGYKYDWKLEEAQKNILRTHTTAVSARNLYRVAQEGFKPCKFFSIDRVFRNETLDATHLAEFYQVEGVIAEEDLSLGGLMGVIQTFFTSIGMNNIKFKPAYNPYTEPSMEIFAYHDGLKKWVEIGNSGMFRPEMLRPMGLPENVRVAGFGLGLERPTMIKYGLSNIRDLSGPKVDIEMIYKNPIFRAEKN